METYLISSIIALIVTILVIVKFWRMANRVKRIEEKLLEADEYYEFNRALFNNDKATLEKLLHEHMVRDFIKTRFDYGTWKNNWSDKIQPIINKYKELYTRSGIELPDFERYTKFEDYLD